MNRRVLITGSGLISALGDTPGAVNTALCNGNSGIGAIDLFDCEGYGSQLGGQIRNYDPAAYLGDRNFRPLDRTGLLAVTAGGLTLGDAGLDPDRLAEIEVGLVLGTMYCSVHTITTFDRNAQTAGIRYAKPMDFANTVINAASGQMGIWHNLRGINSTIATGVASGLKALLYGFHLIQSGQADIVIAGGAEEMSFESYYSFHRANALAAAHGGKPFDTTTNGFHLGEAAAFLVLESEAHAKARGATVRAEILGGEEAYDPSRGKDTQAAANSLAGVSRAAIAESGLQPADIHCISASANGLTQWDQIETQAIADVFGKQQPPITAVKGGLGECLGAGGAVQAVCLVEAMRTGALSALKNDGPAHHSGRFQNGLIQSQGMDGGVCALVLSQVGD